MTSPIILKNKGVLNNIPKAEDLARGEVAVAHRTAARQGGGTQVFNTLYGLFIKVGAAAADDVTDKVVRVGNATVTTTNTSPAQLNTNSTDRDYTGELWYRQDIGQFFINPSGAANDWVTVVPYATEEAMGQVQLASPLETATGIDDNKAITPAGLKAALNGSAGRGLLAGLYGGATYQFFVNESHPNATDAKANDGHSPNKPYRTLQRALLEVARRSFRPGQPLNGINETSSIFIAPGEYPIYNGIGVTNPAFPATGEPTLTQLQGFNNVTRPGVFLPRGCSIVGADLRKVKFYPIYVPNRNGSQGRAEMFRMTGANFFTGFSVFDKPGLLSSHHNLSVFGFSNDADLNQYYDRVAVAFNDPQLYNRLQDSANLVEGNYDFIIKQSVDYAKAVNPTFFPQGSTASSEGLTTDVGAFVDALIQDLRAGGNANMTTTATQLYNGGSPRFAPNLTYAPYGSALEQVANLARQAIVNLLPYKDLSISPDASNPSAPCQDIQSIVTTLVQIADNILQGDPPPTLNIGVFGVNDVGANVVETEIVGPAGSNTVAGASPYIFSASLRSNYGMCGIDGQGDQVTGFKSYLAAQFTVISLQSDPSAFVGVASSAGEVGNKRYLGTSSLDSVDYRHFGYRATDGCYAQLVSCFCIGPANHYWCESGGEFSITNSTSNFGDVSAYSEGFQGFGTNTGAFPQDSQHLLVGIKRPLPIPNTGEAVRRLPIGSFSARGGSTLTLIDPVDFSAINPFTLVSGSTVYLVRPDTQAEISATISTTMNAGSGNKQIIQISNFSGDWSNPNGILTGALVYIKRVLDLRSSLDKVYRLRVQLGPNARIPLPNFVLRLRHAVHGFQIGNTQGSMFFNASVDPVPGVANQYYITPLQGWANPEGQLDNIAFIEPTINLDGDPGVNFPNANPTDSLTYVAINALLGALGQAALRPEVLVPSAQDYGFVANGGLQAPFTVEFNRPSIVRAAGHTWEYCGYYNYDTALPAFQPGAVGDGMVDPTAKLFKIVSKTQTQKKGGRVYATGMDQDGNLYQGTTIISLATGQTQSTLYPQLASSSSTSTFQNVIVTQKLTVLPGAVASLDGQISVSASTTLALSPGATGVLANYDVNAGTTRYGLARPATFNEINSQAPIPATQGGSAFVTPAGLGLWKNAQRIQSQRLGVVNVYIGAFPSQGSPQVLEYDVSFVGNFWPAPTTDPNNPGLPFASFVSFQAAAAFCNNNLSVFETVNLIVAPGKYLIDNCSFRCNIIFNGAFGSGQIGRYDGADAGGIQSVILYQRLGVSAEITGPVSLATPIGFLLEGSGSSYIGSVHFWGVLDAFNDPTLSWQDKPAGTPPTLPQFIQAGITRISSQTNIILSQQVFNFILHPKIYVTADTNLSLECCTIGPHCPAQVSLSGLNGGIYTNSTLAVDEGSLTLTGCRIRGNNRWVFGASSLAPDGQNGQSLGLLRDGGQNLYGHSCIFIYRRGKAKVRFSQGTIHTPYGVTAFNHDRNNNRLERNWGGLYGTVATRFDGLTVTPSVLDQGDDNLGASVAITGATPDADILNQGPIIGAFFGTREPYGTLTLDKPWDSYVATTINISGWKGKFGTIPTQTGATVAGALMIGNYSTAALFDSFDYVQEVRYSSAWRSAGSPPNNCSSITGARAIRNVDAIVWPRGVFGVNSQVGAFLPYVPLTEPGYSDPNAAPSGLWSNTGGDAGSYSSLTPAPFVLNRRFVSISNSLQFTI
jgi:hypothetical protein